MMESGSAVVSLFDSVSDYITKDYVRIDSMESVSSAARQMLNAKSTEAIVSGHDGIPVGIVTERDVLFRVVAMEKNPATTKVMEIMSSPIECVEENLGIGEALLKMIDLQVRRLGVTRQGKIIGLITQSGIMSRNSNRRQDLLT